jgi:aminoglycoside phosphotransferase (APT) family kinase protein
VEPLTDWSAVRRVPFPEPTAEQLAAICERHGLPAGGPFGRLPSTGVINAIITIGDDLLLRLPKDVPEGWRDTLTESVAVPAAMAAGVRTPALVAFDEACDLVDVPYGIYEWWHLRDGEPTSDEGWRALGRDLAVVHGIAEVADPLGRLDTPGRSTSVEELLAAGLEIDPMTLTELRALELAVRDPPPPCFLHDDVKGSNLLVAGNGGYGGIIDWGDAGWGDATIDLRRIPPAATPLVVEGYRDVRPTDDGFEDRLRWDQTVHRLWMMKMPEG